MTLNDDNPPQSDAERVSEPTPAPEPLSSRLEAAASPGYLGPTLRQVPEDLRVPWGWLDLLLLVVIGFAGLLLSSLLVLAAFMAVGTTMNQIKNSIVDQSLFSVIATCLISIALLAYLFAQMRLRFNLSAWHALGWRSLRIGQVPHRAAYLGLILSGFLLSLIVAASSSLFTTKTKMPIEQFLQDRRTALLLLVMSVTLAPLFEETIFRGYIYPVVARSFGVPIGILFTGTIFGLLHSAQLGNSWPQVGLLIFVGIVFTYARARSGTVLASYLLHVSYNSFLFLSFLVASHGFRHFPAAP
ncbi:MAG TPA: CPBP family glutamic-type intramembrane protease [Candidatus Acidoferrales bacterium]